MPEDPVKPKDSIEDTAGSLAFGVLLVLGAAYVVLRLGECSSTKGLVEGPAMGTATVLLYILGIPISLAVVGINGWLVYSMLRTKK
jgi:hypothetical protein